MHYEECGVVCVCLFANSFRDGGGGGGAETLRWVTWPLWIHLTDAMAIHNFD